MEVAAATQTSRDILQNIAKSMGYNNPQYELFSTVHFDRKPNYCYKVTALNLVAVGKGWCEEDAINKGAQILINKYKGVKDATRSNASKKSKKCADKNQIETKIGNLAITDSKSLTNPLSSYCVKQKIISDTNSKISILPIHEAELITTNKCISTSESKKKSKVKRANKRISIDNKMSEDNGGFLDLETYVKSQISSSIKHKMSTSNKSVNPKTNYSNYTYVAPALDTRLSDKIKDSDFGADPIGKLENICIKSKIRLPRYNFLKPSWSENGTIFKIQCSFLGYIVYGRGRTKKIAKSQAAANMMRNMIALGWHIDLA